jgi:hypothetical protein
MSQTCQELPQDRTVTGPSAVLNSASYARALIHYRCGMGFRIAGDRQAIQSGFQSDRVWANDQLCGAPPPEMQEMNSAVRGANPVCS